MVTIPESHRDLLNAPVAILATRGEDAHPQVTALWFLHDEDDRIKLSLNNTRQKVKNLEMHPECTFFILDTANPYRTLEIRANARIELDEGNVFAKKISEKYGGFDASTTDKPDEWRVIVSLEIIKVNTWG